MSRSSDADCGFDGVGEERDHDARSEEEDDFVKGWDCHVCTYTNDEGGEKCQMCDTERLTINLNMDEVPHLLPLDTPTDRPLTANSALTYSDPRLCTPRYRVIDEVGSVLATVLSARFESRMKKRLPSTCYAQLQILRHRYKGSITVHVHQAKGLIPPKKNATTSSLSPFCEVRIGKARYKTSTDADGGDHPFWDENASIKIDNADADCEISISVSTVSTLSNPRIGTLQIGLEEAVRAAGDRCMRWYRLWGGSQGCDRVGFVLLSFSLDPGFGYGEYYTQLKKRTQETSRREEGALPKVGSSTEPAYVWKYPVDFHQVSPHLSLQAVLYEKRSVLKDSVLCRTKAVPLKNMILHRHFRQGAEMELSLFARGKKNHIQEAIGSVLVRLAFKSLHHTDHDPVEDLGLE